MDEEIQEVPQAHNSHVILIDESALADGQHIFNCEECQLPIAITLERDEDGNKRHILMADAALIGKVSINAK